MGRRAFIGTLAGGLLALATSASAECAWGLWVTFTGGARVIGAFATKSECEASADYRAAVATSEQLRSRDNYVVLCLPDTVDPRGPKGK